MTVTVATGDTGGAALGDEGRPPRGGGAETGAAVDGLAAPDRRRLRRAWWAGAVPTLAVFAWIITAGRGELLVHRWFDEFYDAQARAIFDGRLDVPAEIASFEGFLIDGKTYIYFGPVPALLRMPLLAVTDRFDGRLTAVSMLVAMVVLAAAGFRLACALRAIVRGAAPVGRREPLAAAALAVATLAGPPLFLSSAAIVYHEAAIWGLAFTIAGFDAVARWALRPSGRRLALAGALITAAVLSRQSLGFGPLVALALAGTIAGARRLTADDRAGAGRVVAVVALACLVPSAAAVGMNYAKFRTLLAPPIDRHVQSLYFPDRQAALEAGGGSLWGTQFAPTTITQYFRPDGIDLRRDFPWIDFPRSGPTLIGDAHFDEMDWASSLPASAPAATVGTIAATIAAGRAWRRRRRAAQRASAGPAGGTPGAGEDERPGGTEGPGDHDGSGGEARSGGVPWVGDDRRWWTLALLAGAVAGAAGVIPFGYIANRYLNDLYPIVLIGGMVGFHLAAARAGGWSRVTRRLVAIGGGALVAAGVLVNATLALSYQRERGPAVPEAWRADWIEWRLALPGARAPIVVPSGALLPPAAADGQLAVVGDCDGLYSFVRNRWHGIERGPRVGVHDLRVDLDRLGAGERAPLVTLGDETPTIVALRRLDADTVRVDVAVPQPEGGHSWVTGAPVEMSGEVTLRVVADPRYPPSVVSIGARVINGALLDPSEVPPRYGRAPAGYGVAEAYPGGVVLDPVEPDLCRTALELAGGGHAETAETGAFG